MKFMINRHQVSCIEFCQHCCVDVAAPNGYYKLMKASVNCRTEDYDKEMLDYYISEYEKRAKEKGIKL